MRGDYHGSTNAGELDETNATIDGERIDQPEHDARVKASAQQLRELCERQRRAYDQERRRLARQIHDDISQRLTVLSLEVSLLGMAPDGHPPKVPESAKLECLSQMTQTIGQSVRNLTNELHPKILDEFGLAAALHWLEDHSAKDFPCEVKTPAREIELAPELASVLFTLCREAIRDIFRPTGASGMKIDLTGTARNVTVRLQALGNANWRKPRARDGRLVLLGMREALSRWRGTCELAGSRREGLVLTLAASVKPPRKRIS